MDARLWPLTQRATSSFFDEGSRRVTATYAYSAAGVEKLVEQHTPAYLDGGRYMNGNLTEDELLAAPQDRPTHWSNGVTGGSQID